WPVSAEARPAERAATRKDLTRGPKGRNRNFTTVKFLDSGNGGQQRARRALGGRSRDRFDGREAHPAAAAGAEAVAGDGGRALRRLDRIFEPDRARSVVAVAAPVDQPRRRAWRDLLVAV